jgi:DNA polymerase-1
MTGHLTLIDGLGYAFRAFHVVTKPEHQTRRADGTPVWAVQGFTRMILRERAAAERAGEHVAVVFDHSRRSFRHDIYPAYKANRGPLPDDMVPQLPLVREACWALGLPVVEMDGYEADDLIATLARQAVDASMTVTIVSADKDLMQLVTDRVGMYDPVKDQVIGPVEVMAKFGVEPEKVVDVQALAGDAADNVPGVPGIGIKTAAQLITEYGHLDALLARAHEIKQPARRNALLVHAEAARLSRALVTLRSDVPLERPLDSLRPAPRDEARIAAFMTEQGFDLVQPRPGYYYTRLVRGGPKVPVQIWEDGGAILCRLGDRDADAAKLWPFLRWIEEAEYRHMLDTARWATAHAPNEPEANPDRPVDLNQAPIPFGED